MRWTHALPLILSPAAGFFAGNERHEPSFPSGVVAETKSLEFHVSTPSSGSLERQTRQALQELIDKNHGARLVKLRVFATGPAALAASQSTIASTLGELKMPLPALSLVGVAGFPDSSQQVEIESTADGGRSSNPYGVGLIAGLASPTGERTIAGLARVAREAGIPAANVTRVSCFYERADQVAGARAAIASTFPSAEASFVFSYGASAAPAIECEAMSRLSARPDRETVYFNLPGGTPSPNYSHAALVAAPRVVFLGNEAAADGSVAAIRAALERAKSASTSLGATLANVVMGDNYWLTGAARDTVRALRAQYFAGRVPAATGVFFTSLAGDAAGIGIELVVAIPSAPRDTLTLSPGSAAMDGRYLRPHRAEWIETVTRNGVSTRRQHFVMNKTVERVGGRDVFRLQLDALPDAPDTSVHIQVMLDHRTMALLHRDERDGTGQRSVFDVDGAKVAGSVTTPGGVAEPVRFALGQAAFLGSFLDAAANAVSLHDGQVLRLPAFGLGATQHDVTWHDLRVVGRDTLRVGDHIANAAVVEEVGDPNFARRTMWLMREPPYFARTETYLADGSLVRVEQRLLDAARGQEPTKDRRVN